MHEMIENLIQVLQQTQRLYTELGTILEQESRILPAGDIERLENNTAEKKRLLSCLDDSGRLQERLRHQIARHYQMPPDISLTQLAEQMPLPYQQRLLEIGKSLGGCIGSVQGLNQESRLLVQHCLKSVHNALSFLTNRSSHTPVYAASGALGSGASGGRLLSSSV
jgi:flagellar biosynthesis/type III secretory pathway chaperone